jgi:DNA-binding transcriptional ArsR family regulator
MSIKEFKGATQKASAKTVAAAAKSVRRSGAADVVRPEDFVTALANAVRGERAMPDWAGNRVYASPQAREFWEAGDAGAASLSSFARLIGDNRELLQAIERGDAMSVADIAKSVGRAQPNVSRSLSKLERYGVVSLHQGAGRTKQVQISSRRMRFELDVLSGQVTLVPASEATRASERPAPTKRDKQGEGKRAVARSAEADKPSAPRANRGTQTHGHKGVGGAGKKQS